MSKKGSAYHQPLTTNNDLASLTDIAVKTFILPISPTVFCYRVANNVAQGVPHVLHNRFSLLNEKYLQCSVTFLSLEPSALLNSLDTKVTVRRQTLKTYLQRTFSHFFLCRYSGQTSCTHEILPKANDALVILDPQNRKLQSNSVRTQKKKRQCIQLTKRAGKQHLSMLCYKWRRSYLGLDGCLNKMFTFSFICYTINKKSTCQTSCH